MGDAPAIEVTGSKTIGVADGQGGYIGVQVPKGIMLRDFRGLLIAVEHVYDGRQVTAEAVAKMSGTNINLVLKIFATDEFKEACDLRGTPLVPKAGLTEQQMLALPFLLDHSVPTLQQRLRNAKVSAKDYARWKRSPAFKAELSKLAGGMLQDAEVDMITSLASAGANGDMRAIELSLEITGTHNRGDKTQVELRAFATQVLEILTDEIKDRDTLTRIAARIAMAQSGPQTNRMSVREITNG